MILTALMMAAAVYSAGSCPYPGPPPAHKEWICTEKGNEAIDTVGPQMRGKLSTGISTTPLTITDCTKFLGGCGLVLENLAYTGEFSFNSEDAICLALRFRALSQTFNPVGEITAKTSQGTLVCSANVNTPPHWVKP